MEIRRSSDSLISIMGFPLLVRWHLLYRIRALVPIQTPHTQSLILRGHCCHHSCTYNITAQAGKLKFFGTGKNSTRPGLFSTHPAKFSLALASGRVLVSQPAADALTPSQHQIMNRWLHWHQLQSTIYVSFPNIYIYLISMSHGVCVGFETEILLGLSWCIGCIKI